MNSNMVKPEKFGYLRLVYLFSGPLREIINLVKLAIKCFRCNVLIFKNKRPTGCEINIAE